MMQQIKFNTDEYSNIKFKDIHQHIIKKTINKITSQNAKIENKIMEHNCETIISSIHKCLESIIIENEINNKFKSKFEANEVVLIKSKNILEMNKCKNIKKLNSYVSNIGMTLKIPAINTTINDLLCTISINILY